MRLDKYLTDNLLAKSRTFAQKLIDGGYVYVNGEKADRASYQVADQDEITVTGRPYDYVSRGGVKLEAAINAFGINAAGAVCVDIGASSGGFTDCLLKHGACKVYAVDSGFGQLDASLRCDERVVNIEKFNARELDASVTGEKTDIAVCDVSFISQTLILPSVVRILNDDGVYVGLIKPQFECGKAGLGKGGVVKSKKVILSAVEKVTESAALCGLCVEDLIVSPICGGEGNIEYLMKCTLSHNIGISEEYIRKVVGS